MSIFPAAGFRTQSGVTVGLLTDSGYRNQWSRIIRRDGTPVKPAPASIADLNLYYLPKVADRAAQGSYIQQTFGEATVQMSGEDSRKPNRSPATPHDGREAAISKVEQIRRVVKLSPNDSERFRSHSHSPHQEAKFIPCLSSIALWFPYLSMPGTWTTSFTSLAISHCSMTQHRRRLRDIHRISPLLCCARPARYRRRNCFVASRFSGGGGATV